MFWSRKPKEPAKPYFPNTFTVNGETVTLFADGRIGANPEAFSAMLAEVKVENPDHMVLLGQIVFWLLSRELARQKAGVTQ